MKRMLLNSCDLLGHQRSWVLRETWEERCCLAQGFLDACRLS